VDSSAQLAAVTQLVTDVVGAPAIGLYLHGSATSSELRPASDLDLLLVTDRSLRGQERTALLAGLLDMSGVAVDVRPIDMTVVVRTDIVPWRYPPKADFVYGEWLRQELEARGPLPPHPLPDLAVQLAQARECGRPIFGPPADVVTAPVPHRDVVEAGVATVPELLAEFDGDRRNVLLTLARIWATGSTGRLLAKDAAAEWALPLLPEEHRPVLRHAIELYRGCTYADETWPGPLAARARECAEFMAMEIGRRVGRMPGKRPPKTTPVR